jgi:hypothetical protein
LRSYGTTTLARHSVQEGREDEGEFTNVTVGPAADVDVCIQEKEELTLKGSVNLLLRVLRSCVNIMTICPAQVTSMSLFPLNVFPSILIVAPSGTKWATSRPPSWSKAMVGLQIRYLSVVMGASFRKEAPSIRGRQPARCAPLNTPRLAVTTTGFNNS